MSQYDLRHWGDTGAPSSDSGWETHLILNQAVVDASLQQMMVNMINILW